MLPILVLLLLAIGVYVARSHRRALIGAGLGLAASMLVLGAGLLVFRGVYLNGVPDNVLPANAAAALFDTLVRFIREGLRTILVAGLVIAAGAFLTGPSVSAVRIRHAFTAGLAWVRQSGEHAGLRTGPVGTWTYAHRKGLRISAVALAALLFVFWGQAHRRSRDHARRPAPGRARAHRTDRQQAGPLSQRRPSSREAGGGQAPRGPADPGCRRAGFVILQAAGLALLAAISPTALLVAAVYLGSARPRLVGTLYLAGAIVMSPGHGPRRDRDPSDTGLSHRSAHTPRYGLRLGLGVVLLAAGAVLARRKPKMPDPDKKQGLVSRMIANPAPGSAFAVGLLLFAPGITFIAALQVIATANASVESTTVAIILVVIINAAFVWLPLLLHLIAPGLTTRRLTAFNGWLRANGNKILICVLIVGGAIMVGNGMYGLAGGG